MMMSTRSRTRASTTGSHNNNENLQQLQQQQQQLRGKAAANTRRNRVVLGDVSNVGTNGTLPNKPQGKTLAKPSRSRAAKASYVSRARSSTVVLGEQNANTVATTAAKKQQRATKRRRAEHAVAASESSEKAVDKNHSKPPSLPSAENKSSPAEQVDRDSANNSPAEAPVDKSEAEPEDEASVDASTRIPSAVQDKKLETKAKDESKLCPVEKHDTENCNVEVIVQDAIQEDDNNPVVGHVGPSPKQQLEACEADAVAHEQELDERRKSVQPVQEWTNLDAEDEHDPLMVSEYVVEIFDYMRELETATKPDPCYMETQTDLNWSMRGVLIDWLIDVHSKFRLLPETLYLAVNLADRFLSKAPVSMGKFQLVGLTALFVAAKYEEVMCPSIASFIYMAEDDYTDEEVLTAERYMLETLDFRLCYPNPMNFLRRISKADHYNLHSRTIAKFLMEISILDARFLDYVPSRVAAGAMLLAREILFGCDMGPEEVWDANLTHYSGYSTKELRPVAELMLSYLRTTIRDPAHENFIKKYSSRKLLRASIFVREWLVEKDQGPM